MHPELKIIYNEGVPEPLEPEEPLEYTIPIRLSQIPAYREHPQDYIRNFDSLKPAIVVQEPGMIMRGLARIFRRLDPEGYLHVTQDKPQRSAKGVLRLVT